MSGSSLIRFIAHVCALLVLLIPAACEKKGPSGTASAPAAVGSPAPDFSLKDIDGKVVRLSDLRGKVVLLEFWATWCSPCKDTIPALVALNKQFTGKDFALISISMDEGSGAVARLREFSSRYRISYPILPGTQETAEAYSVRGVPMSILIDKKGTINNTHVGFMDNYQTVIAGEVDKLL
jgi:peroxiredoxin